MTYNRVATPRMYMDRLSFDLTTGQRTISNYTIIQDDGSTAVTFVNGQVDDLFDMRPTNFVTIELENEKFYIYIDTGQTADTVAETNFIAILGHNFHSSDAVFSVQQSDVSNFSTGVSTVTAGCTRMINATADANGNYVDPPSNGWTLVTWTDDGDADNQYKRIIIEDDDGTTEDFASDVKIGAIMMGEYIDFPNSPDLDVGFSIDYDGTKLINSVGGNTYAQASHLGSAPWGGTNPWVLEPEDTQVYKLARHYGRRRYDMNFSYVADTNLFLSNMHSAHGAMVDGSDLYSQFFHKSLGQQMPFLFTIDSTSTNEGDYGLYRLDDSKIKTKQVAHQAWNTSLSLVESW